MELSFRIEDDVEAPDIPDGARQIGPGNIVLDLDPWLLIEQWLANHETITIICWATRVVIEKETDFPGLAKFVPVLFNREQKWELRNGIEVLAGFFSIKDLAQQEYVYIVVRIEFGDISEWRIYLVNENWRAVNFCATPPSRVTGRCGDAVFDETTGIIEIAVANGPTGSRHYIFRPGQEGWPEAYLEGWTEGRYLRSRADDLCERVQRLSAEKKALEEVIAGAVKELNQLIGQEALKSIRNPLAALLRPNDSCVQHCAEEIRSALEAIRDRLQPLAEAD